MEQEDFLQLLPKLSYQLRSALSNIHMAAAAIAPNAQRDANPTLDAQAAVLDQGCYQLLHLVNNLTLTALLADTAPLATEELDLVQLVGELCTQSESLARLLGLELTFRCGEISHVCAVNRGAMEQLVFQLLSNAFKFTPAGGRVTVELKFSARRARLVVSDTGCGIAEDLLPTLFSHCANGDPAAALPPHGAGLGLLVCQRIARGHGGTIMAESHHGAVITVSFPETHTEAVAMARDHFPALDCGFSPALVGLADALPAAAFRIREQE